MTNKTIALSDKIINGSIKDIYSDLLDLKDKRLAIEQKVEELGLKEKIEELENKQENLSKNEDRKKRQIRDLEVELEELNDDIIKLAAKTQRKVRKLTNQDVKINIKE